MSANHGDAASPAPGRIRRNQACNACRDAKVRCNASALPGRPCQRCAKLALSCVVDRTHKRISRKSKIDELVREIQTIKQAVASGPSPPPATTTAEPSRQPLLSREPVSAPRAQPDLPAASRDAGPGAASGRSAPSASPPGPATPASGPTLARALESQPFSGEDIDYYFDMYFTHFHPYLPIVRQRAPNACYAAGPALFWTIVLVACRRYARTAGALAFLTGAVRRALAAAAARPPLALPAVNALLLAGAWAFPDTRFVSDGSALLAATAVHSALPLGLHTGRGAHPEFGFGGIFPTAFCDEEAAYTWAGCSIVSQRISQYMGLPSLGGLFNSTIQKIIDGKTAFAVPPGFRVLLECQKFAHRVSTILGASLDESRGVAPYLVRQLEDEFDSIQVLICSEKADRHADPTREGWGLDDMDRFSAQLVRLEIQTYYLLPLPGRGAATAGQQRDAARAGATARAVLREALALERQRRFLQHAPHWYFRALFAAVCVVTTVQTAPDGEDEDAAFNAAVADGIEAARRSVVQDGDLAARLAVLLESYHNLVAPGGGGGEPVSAFMHRLGASVTFACVKHWKDELASARSKSLPPPPNVPAGGGDALAGPGVAGASADAASGIDLLAGIDWSFMDDFDWGLGEPAPTAAGAGWQ